MANTEARQVTSTDEQPSRAPRSLEAASAEASASDDGPIAIQIEDLNAYYGKVLAVEGVSLGVRAKSVTAIIGPSGCGKSTLLRCINRLHEVIPGAHASGRILLDGVDVYAPDVDATRVRQRIGMVFQKPNPFPTMSIAENVASGLRLLGLRSRSEIDDRVEDALKSAALWDEVKTELKKPGIALSGGQQQRLCIARAIAVQPEVVLMDEPCSALDPVATTKVEDLITSLGERYTIVIVTHNLQQAARVSKWTAFMLAAEERIGRLVEYAPTDDLFLTPKDKRTEEYVTGRFG